MQNSRAVAFLANSKSQGPEGGRKVMLQEQREDLFQSPKKWALIHQASVSGIDLGRTNYFPGISQMSGSNNENDTDPSGSIKCYCTNDGEIKVLGEHSPEGAKEIILKEMRNHGFSRSHPSERLQGSRSREQQRRNLGPQSGRRKSNAKPQKPLH